MNNPTYTAHSIMKQFSHVIRGVLLLILSLVIGTVAVHAQQYTFQVNMEHVHLEPGDKVAVRGSIASLGNWEEKGELLLRKNRNNEIYSGSINMGKDAVAGKTLYKYVIIRRNGVEQWEERGNRVLDASKEQTVWFDDRSEPGIRQTIVQVTVQLDLTDHSMNGYPAESVAIMGAHAPLGWNIDADRTLLNEGSEGIWSTTLNFPYGTPHDVPFKFAWKHNDEWIWEWRAGHSNHVFLIDDSGTEQTIALRYDVNKPGVVPTEGSAVMVDNYDAVLARMGDKAVQSRYQYEKAMKQLEEGNLKAATQTYAQYKTAHPGGEEIDDFAYRMVYALEKSQGYKVAKEYLEAQRRAETISERKQYFDYLEGELALNTGRNQQARDAFKKLLKENKEGVATEYSRKAMVHSYLTENDPDSVKKGVRLLEQYAAVATEKQKRPYTVQLSRAYRIARMEKEQEQALIELSTMGTEGQQAASKIELARTYVRNGKYTEAMGFLDTVDEHVLVERDKLRKTRLQIELYHELEMHTEVATMYEEYVRKHPNDTYRKRLNMFNKNAVQKLGTNRINPQQGTATPDSTQHRREQ